MKRKAKKLNLNRETLRSLEDPSLLRVQAAALAGDPVAIAISKGTNCISICLSCTTPLDTCPDPTIV